MRTYQVRIYGGTKGYVEACEPTSYAKACAAYGWACRMAVLAHSHPTVCLIEVCNPVDFAGPEVRNSRVERLSEAY